MNKRHTPEQIVRKLRDADAELALAAGASNPEVARKLGISERRPCTAGATTTVG
jgi:DNA-binding NarL/FixJ family response regulator